jgi:alkyldihydroxyacetonephosphate synthase
MTHRMHWARWGDPAGAAPLSDDALALVELAFGGSTPRPTTPLADIRLPACALTDAHLAALTALVGTRHVHVDHETRVRHTRGKSTPDLLRMRSGDASAAPDAVVYPAGHDEVAAVLRWCTEERVAAVPFGGGTSVVGGLVADRQSHGGVVALDLARLDGLVSVDTASATAVLEAGVTGPDAEALLAAHGVTLGHFPQSFEYATIGGYAATRSSGQSSSGYGRFDAMVTGLRVATPIGDLTLGRAPATAAGLDVRALVLGSEGAFGVITEVTLRVRPAPPVKEYAGWRFDSFTAGVDALRALARSGSAPTVLRLSDETETSMNLAEPDAVGSASGGGCLMVTGFEGTRDQVEALRASTARELTARGGAALGAAPGAAWVAGRFKGPYLRDSMLDVGVLVETVETATYWSGVPRVYDAVRRALTTRLTHAIVMCHVSHVYETGASLYFTVAAPQQGDGLEQWAGAKTAACEAIVASDATITHHHGVGHDHKRWLVDEIGPVGIEMLRAVKQRLDPAGILNPGVLLP